MLLMRESTLMRIPCISFPNGGLHFSEEAIMIGYDVSKMDNLAFQLSTVRFEGRAASRLVPCRIKDAQNDTGDSVISFNASTKIHDKAIRSQQLSAMQRRKVTKRRRKL